MCPRIVVYDGIMLAKHRMMRRWVALLGIVGLSWLALDYASQSATNAPETKPALSLSVTVHDVAEVSAPSPLTVENTGFDSTPASVRSNRLLADWNNCDQSRWITSPWISLLTGVVDPLFSKSDGLRFYSPNTLDSFRDSVRRPASFAVSGGLKFSRSF